VTLAWCAKGAGRAGVGSTGVALTDRCRGNGRLTGQYTTTRQTGQPSNNGGLGRFSFGSTECVPLEVWHETERVDRVGG
jgi:hypothetical protein